MDLYTSDAIPEPLRKSAVASPMWGTSARKRSNGHTNISLPVAPWQSSSSATTRIEGGSFALCPSHPATVAYEKQLYRLSRDVIPILFVGEHIYELITGKEAFTGDEVSHVWALVELGLAIIGARVLRAIKPAAKARPPVRALTEPLLPEPPAAGRRRDEYQRQLVHRARARTHGA